MALESLARGIETLFAWIQAFRRQFPWLCICVHGGGPYSTSPPYDHRKRLFLNTLCTRDYPTFAPTALCTRTYHPYSSKFTAHEAALDVLTSIYCNAYIVEMGKVTSGQHLLLTQRPQRARQCLLIGSKSSCV